MGLIFRGSIGIWLGSTRTRPPQCVHDEGSAFGQSLVQAWEQGVAESLPPGVMLSVQPMCSSSIAINGYADAYQPAQRSCSSFDSRNEEDLSLAVKKGLTSTVGVQTSPTPHCPSVFMSTYHNPRNFLREESLRTSHNLEKSKEHGIAQSVISRLWQRFQDDGNGSRCYSTGRPRVTTLNEDRYLAITAKRNRRSTASNLSRQLSSATGTTVSRQTVYRRLGHIGLYARRPVRCVPLTATHCRLRLTWSREHPLWTPQQWSCVMFSDDSRFSLQSNSRRTLIWSAPGTRYHQENTIERHRYGGTGWLVWGGIILGSRTDLHVQSVTMTGHIYRDVILENHVRLFGGAMGAEFLFMDDNAHPHRANIVDECLQSEDITRMVWPAYSPDLNPKEHVLDMLARRIAARQPPPTCLLEFWRALLDEWCNIPQDQIDNLILSMPRRCKVCIASFGRHTINHHTNHVILFFVNRFFFEISSRE
ncbi:transposable element Tcb1 transposase [Trichonephila clavipes]|nr:transposable element Tcb1 transposase [Trichonephila clavipes]